ncbi:MAG: hypothetical protein RR389_03905 [Christensenella sp.]
MKSLKKYQSISGPLSLILVRLLLGIVAIIFTTLRFIKDIGGNYDKILQSGQNEAMQWIVFLMILNWILGIVMVLDLVYMSRNNKKFILFYIVLAVLNIIFGFLSKENNLALIYCGIEPLLILYLLTSKKVALRFDFYNKINKTAIRAFALKNRRNSNEEINNILYNLENAANLYRQNSIDQQEFVRIKSKLLKAL